MKELKDNDGRKIVFMQVPYPALTARCSSMAFFCCRVLMQRAMIHPPTTSRKTAISTAITTNSIVLVGREAAIVSQVEILRLAENL